MSTISHDIDAALLDVRKAFRLLHNYQRLALDAAKYIGTQLGFRYGGGWSRFSWHGPKNGKGKLENWAWDWLNMMWYEFYFEPEAAGKEPFYFSLWLVSDTGYFASEDPAAERTALDLFASPEVSSTKVVCLLYDDKADYDSIYAFGAESKEMMRRFLDLGETPEVFERGKVFAKAYDFARLMDEQTTDALIDDLIRSAGTKGFSLARVGKAG